MLPASNEALKSKLGGVLHFSGPRDVVVDGANLHVQNGMGQTGTLNRYGNQNAVSGSNSVVTGGQHCDFGAADDRWAAGLLASPGGCSALANWRGQALRPCFD